MERMTSVPSDANWVHEGPWAATVALRRVVMGWIHGGPISAFAFAGLAFLLGLLSRRYLPTRSIFDLMLHGG